MYFNNSNLLKIWVIIGGLLLMQIGGLFAQDPGEPTVVLRDKPGFYTGFITLGYQTRDLAFDFSTLNYRTSLTGLMLSYTSRYGGLNLNLGRALTVQTHIFNKEATLLINWIEAGVNFPLLRLWRGYGFLSKCSVLLTANTSLFERLYKQPDASSERKASNYIYDSFPQNYDFGLELRRNLISFKLGYLMQLKKYAPSKIEFNDFPDDISGPYFEVSVSFGGWNKRQETQTIKARPVRIAEVRTDVRARVQFDEPSGNRKLDGGENGVLKIDLKNNGKGFARNIELHIRFVEGRNQNLSFPRTLKVKELAPGSATSLEIPVTASQEIENGQVNFEVQVIGQNFDSSTEEIAFDVLAIDVTDDPRRTGINNSDAVAVVIGISKYQNPGIPSVEFAAHDARIMREYLIKTMGFNPNNILPKSPDELITAGSFKTLIKNILPTYIHAGTSEVFFFYAGHGAPNTTTKEAFLVPYDCDPNFVTVDNAYKLNELYFDLISLDAQHVTVVIDACFSGQTGDGSAIVRNISPVGIKVKDASMAAPNMTRFASSQVSQVSNWFPEKKHGLFTYFFLKGLRGAADLNGDRRITEGEMREFLTNEQTGVPYWSNREFQRLQRPDVQVMDIDKVMINYGDVADR